MKPAVTPVGEVAGIVAGARAAFASGMTLPLSWRSAQIRAIARMVEENRAAILSAVAADLKKPPFEADLSEVELVLQEAAHTLSHLPSWAAPQSVHTPLMFFPASSYLYYDPLGVACIITPWNFPFCALRPSPCQPWALLAARSSPSSHDRRPHPTRPQKTWP